MTDKVHEAKIELGHKLDTLDMVERSTLKVPSSNLAKGVEVEYTKVGSNFYTYLCSLMSAFGGFLFGYDIGIIGAVTIMNDFRSEFDFSLVVDGQKDDENTTTQIAWIISSFLLGCAISSLFGGMVADRIGRKWATQFFCVIFIVGGTLQTFAIDVSMMYLGRVLAGVGIGSLSLVAPMYISECAPTQVRGRLVCLQQLAITFGIMIAFFINLGLENVHPNGWRFALGGQLLFGVIMFIGIFFLPESPRYLISLNKVTAANSVLQRLRGLEDVDEELTIIQQQLDYERSLGQATWGELFGSDLCYRTIFGCMLLGLQQFTGINVIMYYAPTIFNILNLPATFFNAMVGVVNFLSTFLALWLVDKYGRRGLLLLGASGMFLAQLVAALTSLIGGEDNTVGGYIIVVCVFFFIINFAYSWGPIGWLIPAEIFPLRARAKAMSLTTFSNWIINFAVGEFSPYMLNSMNIGWCFLFYCCWVVVMGIFILICFPETKGKTLEKVDELFAIRKYSDWKIMAKSLVRGTFSKKE